MSDILARILATKAGEIAAAKRARPPNEIESAARSSRRRAISKARCVRASTPGAPP
jgi:hypothetical protein